MNIELKSVKVMPRMSEETTCFAATIHIDGRKVADVENSGKGGSHRYHWWERQAESVLDQHAKSKGMKNYGTFSAPYDTDTIVDELLERYEQRKLCRKGIVFRLPTDAPGMWRILKTTSRPEAVLYIETKHPGSSYEILNDLI